MAQRRSSSSLLEMPFAARSNSTSVLPITTPPTVRETRGFLVCWVWGCGCTCVCLACVVGCVWLACVLGVCVWFVVCGLLCGLCVFCVSE